MNKTWYLSAQAVTPVTEGAVGESSACRLAKHTPNLVPQKLTASNIWGAFLKGQCLMDSRGTHKYNCHLSPRLQWLPPHRDGAPARLESRGAARSALYVKLCIQRRCFFVTENRSCRGELQIVPQRHKRREIANITHTHTHKHEHTHTHTRAYQEGICMNVIRNRAV